MSVAKNRIAKNVATLFKDGEVINLGIGIPTLAVQYIPDEISVFIHAECGTIGCGEIHNQSDLDRDIVDATGIPVRLMPGGSCVDSAASFGIVRGGHLDSTILGAFQVDLSGNLANWIIPGKAVTGMGGAMDLVSGAKKVIVAMIHNSKDGASKLVARCDLPLTAVGAVTHVVTELCIIEIVNNKFLVKAIAPGLTEEELQRRSNNLLFFTNELYQMVE